MTAKRVGFPFSEETVTETVLLNLATANPHQVHIIPFNKHEEGNTGADWEWCFYSYRHSQFLPMLMQAKVLDDNDRQYAHIDRMIGNTGVRQIDRLLATAQRRGVAALYAFYNHLADPSRVPAQACSCCECEKCWGCSIAPAASVCAMLSRHLHL